MSSNFDTALKEEQKKCTRCFHAYSSVERAELAASFRLGYQQRRSMGEFFWTHPAFPNTAFSTRKRAAEAALAQHDARGDSAVSRPVGNSAENKGE